MLLRRSAFFAVPGILVILLVVLTLAGARLLSARRHLTEGASDIRHTRTLLSPISRITDSVARARVRRSLLEARAEFGAARNDLQPLAGALDRLGWMPRVGRELAAALPAADTAYYATDSAVHLLDSLSAVWPVITHRGGHGAILVRLEAGLVSGQPQMRAAQVSVDRAHEALARLPSRTGNRSLDADARRLRQMEPVLRSATHWLAVAPLILGAGEPSHELIVLQNPAELRATGGFVGAAGFDTLRDGALSTRFSGSALPHEIDGVPTPLPETLYTSEGAWIFRDANWSPDFPLSARLLRWFYGEDTGRWADGVVGIVDTGITRLLAATGPVFVSDYGVWVNKGNVETLSQQYVHGVPGGRPGVGKQFLGSVITALIARLQALPSSRWQAVGDVIAEAAARRDVMLYDGRPTVETAIRLSGVDGSLVSAPGDYLAIVDDNRSYSKLNPYVDETGTYTASVQADGSVRATLTLRYTVRSSPANLEGAGPNFGLSGSKHDYQDFLRVFVPAGARLIGMRGADRWAPAAAYGLEQFAGRVYVRASSTRTVTIRYVLPSSAGVVADGRYRLSIRRQPGANLHILRVVVAGQSGVSVGGRRELGLSVPVDRDRHLRISVSGVSAPSTHEIGSQTRTSDPYVPFPFFRDPRHPL